MGKKTELSKVSPEFHSVGAIPLWLPCPGWDMPTEHGGCIGQMIQERAEAISDTVNKHYKVFRDVQRAVEEKEGLR